MPSGWRPGASSDRSRDSGPNVVAQPTIAIGAKNAAPASATPLQDDRESVIDLTSRQPLGGAARVCGA